MMNSKGGGGSATWNMHFSVAQSPKRVSLDGTWWSHRFTLLWIRLMESYNPYWKITPGHRKKKPHCIGLCRKQRHEDRVNYSATVEWIVKVVPEQDEVLRENGILESTTRRALQSCWAMVVWALLSGHPSSIGNILALRYLEPASCCTAKEEWITLSCLMFFKRSVSGCVKGGSTSVRQHKWFAGMDWDAIFNGQVQYPTIVHVRADKSGRRAIYAPWSGIEFAGMTWNVIFDGNMHNQPLETWHRISIHGTSSSTLAGNY